MNTRATPASTLANEALIKNIAMRAGLAAQWQDAHGQTRHVPTHTLITLLTALGLPCGKRSDATASLATLNAEHHRHTLPALITAECGRALTLPATIIRKNKSYRIELESGALIEGRFTAPNGETALLAPIDEPGYHTLVLNEQRIRLAVAPSRCYTVEDAWRAAHASPPGPPALWGIATQLYSLRRVGDGGIGDYSTLATLAAQSAQYGAQAIAMSPVHAMFNAEPRKFNPYAPSSRLFLNITHIDPANEFGAQALRTAIDATKADNAWAQLETLPLIDWPRALALRLQVLRILFNQFHSHERTRLTLRNLEFETFRAKGGQALENHARFEAIHTTQYLQHGSTNWRDWPHGLSDPTRAEVEAFAQEHRNEVDFHLFLQWLAAKGLAHAQRVARDADMSIGLISTLAVGCDNTGSDAWSYRNDMLQEVSIGAPPDPFNPAGQSWGLTTFSPRALHAQGFSGFIDMLRAVFTHTGGVHIEHILGLQRLWLAPHGESPANGAYLHYPLDDLLRLIALESWRHRAIVIGEDLGAAPDGFRERLATRGFLGTSVLWFERTQPDNAFTPPMQWPRTSIATTTTHDLPTVCGWWQGVDLEWRARMGQTLSVEQENNNQDSLIEEKSRRDADRTALWRAVQQARCAPPNASRPSIKQAPLDETLAFISSVPTPLVLYPLEDLLEIVEQPNLLGSIDEHPNWRRRYTLPIEKLFTHTTFTDRLLSLAEKRKQTAHRLAEPPASPT